MTAKFPAPVMTPIPAAPIGADYGLKLFNTGFAACGKPTSECCLTPVSTVEKTT